MINPISIRYNLTPAGIRILAPHDRPAIVALLVSLGMSERANPHVLAWAGLAGENAP